MWCLGESKIRLFRWMSVVLNRAVGYSYTFWQLLFKSSWVSKCCGYQIDCHSKEPKSVWPPLINSHSFMQTLANQKSRSVSSWLLIGLNLYKRMWITQKWSHFWAQCCNRPFARWCHFTNTTRILASDWIKSVWKNVHKSKAVTLLGSLL